MIGGLHSDCIVTMNNTILSKTRYWLHYFFGIRGRASRKDFWVVQAIIFAVWILFFLILLSIFSKDHIDTLQQTQRMMEFSSLEEEQAYLAERRDRNGAMPDVLENKPPVPMLVEMIILCIATLWSLIAIHVRRFHDTNQTGWFVLGIFIPYIGWAVVTLWCGFMGGTEGSNRYGDPR
jgi:uncharacterized membrane protein YhaH (DUF805 family)